MKLHTYLTFNGNCEAAFRFYEQNLGGKITALMRFGESPQGTSVAPEMRDKIIHAAIEIGDVVLMASDAMHATTPVSMSGFSISINVDTAEQAEKVFAVLAEGGVVGMPLTPTFWATRFGYLNDRFGVPWMVNCEAKAEDAADDKMKGAH